MNQLLDTVQHDLFNPKTLLGALSCGLVFLGVATVLAALVRRFARRMEAHLSDVTGLRFVSLAPSFGLERACLDDVRRTLARCQGSRMKTSPETLLTLD